MTTSTALKLSRRTICRLILGMMAAPAALGSRSRIPGHSAIRNSSTKGCTVNLSRFLLALGRNGAIYLVVMGLITR